MNERLSRLDRNGSRSGRSHGNRRGSKGNAQKPTTRENENSVEEAGTTYEMLQAEYKLDTTVEGEPDIEKLPTRKEMFPSQRLKLTKWFYNSLLYIFVIIMIYLLWWGLSDSPWGKRNGL